MISKNSVNRVVLAGYVGQDPEIKYTTSGHAVATFSLATNEVGVDAEKNKIEHTEWHNIVAWNKLAEFAEKYIKKGQLIYLEGRIHTQSWIDKNEVRKKKVEIVSETITPLEWKRKK